MTSCRAIVFIRSVPSLVEPDVDAIIAGVDHFSADKFDPAALDRYAQMGIDSASIVDMLNGEFRPFTELDEEVERFRSHGLERACGKHDLAAVLEAASDIGRTSYEVLDWLAKLDAAAGTGEYVPIRGAVASFLAEVANHLSGGQSFAERLAAHSEQARRARTDGRPGLVAGVRKESRRLENEISEHIRTAERLLARLPFEASPEGPGSSKPTPERVVLRTHSEQRYIRRREEQSRRLNFLRGMADRQRATTRVLSLIDPSTPLLLPVHCDHAHLRRTAVLATQCGERDLPPPTQRLLPTRRCWHAATPTVHLWSELAATSVI